MKRINFIEIILEYLQLTFTMFFIKKQKNSTQEFKIYIWKGAFFSINFLNNTQKNLDQLDSREVERQQRQIVEKM